VLLAAVLAATLAGYLLQVLSSGESLPISDVNTNENNNDY
jgi:hypothetical protein